MTTFPARVIAEYERTGNEIIGRALEKARWERVSKFGATGWVYEVPKMKLDYYPIEAIDTHAQSLAYCLLMELRKHAYPLHLFNAIDYLADDDAPDRILAACIEAGRSGV